MIGRERIRADIGSRTLAWQVVAVASIVVGVLLVLADSYGFHRDELYFIVAGRHPDWGYVDQPPITPLVSAGAVALFGLSPLSVRILPALAVAMCIILAGDMARQLGGSVRAQLIAATTVGLSGFLGTGHLGTTTTFDLLAWTVVLWLAVRLLTGSDRRLWLGVGLAAGIGLENKDLVLFLGLSLGVGLVVSRRWDVVRSPWVWSAVGIAFVLWLPNLVWQASHGVPQLELARHIGTTSGDANRALLLPFQLLISGPVLFPIMLAGLGWLVLDPLASPYRAIAWAYLALLVVLVITGGKGYYAVGYLPPLIAAGAIATDRWLARGQRLVRGSSLVVATFVSGLGIALLTLPILPAASLGSTPINDIFKEAGEQVGWPTLVETVQGVVDGLPAADRARTIVFTSNYGEAGALTLLGGTGMPPVYSGHNSFADWGLPLDSTTVTVLVGGSGVDAYYGRFLGPCVLATRIDNGLGLDNDEQGAGVWECRGRSRSWAEIWGDLRRVD